MPARLVERVWTVERGPRPCRAEETRPVRQNPAGGEESWWPAPKLAVTSHRKGSQVRFRRWAERYSRPLARGDSAPPCTCLLLASPSRRQRAHGGLTRG